VWQWLFAKVLIICLKTILLLSFMLCDDRVSSIDKNKFYYKKGTYVFICIKIRVIQHHCVFNNTFPYANQQYHDRHKYWWLLKMIIADTTIVKKASCPPAILLISITLATMITRIAIQNMSFCWWKQSS